MREDSRNYRPINLTSSRNTRVLGNHQWHEVQQRKTLDTGTDWEASGWRAAHQKGPGAADDGKLSISKLYFEVH